MIESSIINFKNKILEFSQNKLAVLVQNSLILSEIDKIILFFISATIILTTFAGTNTIGAAAMVVIFLTLIKLFTLKGQKIELTSWDGALWIYLIFCIISTINSTLLVQSLMGLSKTLIYLGFYFSVLQYLRYNPRKIYYFLFLIAIICTSESIIGLLQQKSGVLAGATWQDTSYLNPEDVLTRVFGTLKPYNPNLYGGYLVCTIPAILAMMFINLKNAHYKSFAFWALPFTISVLAIFYSGCRGAYIGIAAILAALILVSYKIIQQDYNFNDKIKKIWWGLAGAVAAGSAAILITIPAITKRLLSIFSMRTDSSTSFRINVYNSSLEMFRDNWLFGIGVGNKVFREIYGLYMLSGFDALSAYCVFLEIGIESGIFALLAFISFLILILITAIKFINSSTDIKTKIVVSCCIFVIIGVMLHGLVDTVFFRPQIQIIFWIIVAILSVCATTKEGI